MPFDIVLHITEDSQRGRAIQEMVDAQHVTPELVIERIIDDGIQAQQALPPQTINGKKPGEMFFGWFASPEEAADVMDGITHMIYEDRKRPSTRNIG
ncbi:MAG: hypothetical protein ACLQVD_08400 [Capsulimonadaceae bacterium]